MRSAPFIAMLGILLEISHFAMAALPTYYDPLALEIESAMKGAKDLPAERQELLRKAAEAINARLREDGKVSLIYICTANSRRSQLGQVWGKVAAMHYGLEELEAYSGGTQATACNPRTINALERIGFQVDAKSSGENPRYAVRYKENGPIVELYSKKFTDEANPQRGFIALMCCDDADEACPVVPGAAARFRLSYEDPKQADGTDDEAAVYDERSRQIAAEMFFLMKQVAERR